MVRTRSGLVYENNDDNDSGATAGYSQSEYEDAGVAVAGVAVADVAVSGVSQAPSQVNYQHPPYDTVYDAVHVMASTLYNESMCELLAVYLHLMTFEYDDGSQVNFTMREAAMTVANSTNPVDYMSYYQVIVEYVVGRGQYDESSLPSMDVCEQIFRQFSATLMLLVPRVQTIQEFV